MVPVTSCLFDRVLTWLGMTTVFSRAGTGQEPPL